jgi:hypothetical protein
VVGLAGAQPGGALAGGSKLDVIFTRRIPSSSPKKAWVRSMSAPMAVMWCMPSDSAMSGVMAGTGSGQVSAAMRASSRLLTSISGGGARKAWPSASGSSSRVQPGPSVAISMMAPSGSVK